MPPPPLPPASERVCQHYWCHIETSQEHDTSGYGRFVRRDIFYCPDCTELKVATQSFYRQSADDRTVPEWFTGPVKDRRYQ